MKYIDKFYSYRWGVFNHFLYVLQNNPNLPNSRGIVTSWDELVNEFDAKALAKQLNEIGARYYVITVMQGTKYMIAPNKAFDEIAGTKPGEACSTRDLVMDISNALDEYGIDLFLYFTGDGPYKNEDVGIKFGFIEPKLPSLSFKEPELWAFSKSNPGKIGRYKGLETEITFPSEWKGSPVTGVASTTSKVPENYLAITSVVLPEGYTSIGDYAFYGCENLEKITLPSTLQTIGKEAFHGCKKLKEIIMPDSLTTIGENAFSYCSALEKVRFSEDITQIPEYAFYCCNQLEEVDLPESVQWIEKGCFESIGLKKLTVRCKHLYANGKCFGSKPEVYVYHKDAVKDVYGIAKRSVQVIGEEKASKEGTSSRKNSGLWEFSSVDSITFQDKIFVLSGFGADEEAKIIEKIQSLGGVVKNSTVVKTDYLIVMEEYNRVTTKYQKAKELQAQGKNLAIISSATFYSLIQ